MDQESTIHPVLEPMQVAHSLWRHKWVFAAVSAFVFVCGMIAILNIPAIYRSTGMILVEQQEIPTQWVNSTVASYADERIQAIGQRVLNTENLVRIIEKFNLYSDSRSGVAIDALVARVRDNFSIENVQATVRDRRTGARASATVAFRVSFDYPDPEVARDVAEELVSLYLNENKQSRTKAIVDTREFLESEADRLEQNLLDIEREISKFKEDNVGILPEHQTINLQTYQRIEEQIADVDRSLSALDERRIILEAGIDSAVRSIESDTTASVDPIQERLGELRAEYSRMQTRYSDVHPDLVKTKREIESLENSLSGEGADDSGEVLSTVATVNSESEDTALIRLNTDLRTASSERASLRRRRDELVATLADLDEKINRAPAVEREWKSLVRDLENIQDKYNDIRSKQNSARVAESLEADQKGERFTLIEPPRLPLTPHEPNRKMLSVAALGLSMLAGLGSILGIEVLQGKVRGSGALQRATNLPVLATVGYIENRSDRKRRRIRRIIFLLVMIAIIAGVLFAMNRYGVSIEDFDPSSVKMLVNELKQYFI